MIAAPINEQQARNHECAPKKPEVAGGSGKQPLEPLSNTFGRSEVGNSLDETYKAEYGKYIPFQHHSFLV